MKQLQGCTDADLVLFRGNSCGAMVQKAGVHKCKLQGRTGAMSVPLKWITAVMLCKLQHQHVTSPTHAWL